MVIRPPIFRHRERGSVLMLVLWAIALLSVLMMAWSELVSARLERFNHTGDKTKARFAALSGLRLGMNGGIPEHSELLRDWQIEPQLSVDVVVESEGGRLNLNYLLSRTLIDEGVRPLFREYLEVAFAVPPDQVDPLIDALLDWVDSDSVTRLNGIEEEDGYRAANRYFENLDEIMQVRGSEWMTRKEGWRDQLTLWSSGKLDINWANQDLLAALPGIDEKQAESIHLHIAGADGILRTEDDTPFTSLQEFYQFVSLSEAESNLMAPWITNQDNTKRISATGKSHDVTHQVEVIVQGRNANTAIKHWREK